VRKIILTLTLTLLTFTALAKPAPKKTQRKPTTAAIPCKAIAWPYSKNLTGVNEKTLAIVPRQNLYFYLFWELSQPGSQRVPNLSQKLFWYLKNSEPNAEKMNLVSALEYAYTDNSGKVNVIKEAELCGLWRKVDSP